ncbi:UNVERIFIED_CONTAM: hypothetical protein PYX00_001137 [Menopon gallinae]|uniref:Uncharacterized protein n=1 Tax=Menopon gallinae TaxID=328185 RepID=A0AAW2ICI4_9NEOP
MSDGLVECLTVKSGLIRFRTFLGDNGFSVAQNALVLYETCKDISPSEITNQNVETLGTLLGNVNCYPQHIEGIIRRLRGENIEERRGAILEAEELALDKMNQAYELFRDELVPKTE